ncbi:uncharacterized protein LOC111900907 [Lactuca sativa]|uniref:uncharacterized protein LOC111900907 n=1 Tax=Lactuca sativa TaxID=4236 RepID=UPI000CD9A284|nr:uncharacterized protein LOC111900907 [Lactuca sativa]
MEFNLIFVMGLRKEWRNVSMMVKNQQSFDTSTLNDVYNQLKSHVNEVNEIAEETRASLGGPLALVSKMTEKEIHEKSDSDGEEGFIMNSDDEAIAFYSNNHIKKFFKKPFNSKIKSTKIKGSFVNKTASDEKKKEEKNDAKLVEGKIEKKLKGDAGVDYHYCNGANHLANDCMLSKKDEKKNKVKDEAYYAERLEEVPAKAKKLSLVAMGEQEDDGTYQVWSSGSDDEEMRNPTHGAMFAKMEEEYDEEAYKVKGRCFVSKAADKYPMTTKKVIAFFSLRKRAKVDNISYDCEKEIAEFDKVPDDRYRYGIVKVDECLDATELVEITETSTSDGQSNFADIEDNSDNISEINDLEDVDCSQLSIINVASSSKGKEKVNDLDSQTDDCDDEKDEKLSKEKVFSKDEEIPRIVVDQVYGYTQKYEKVLKEQDDVVFPNQVFITTGNVENVKPEFKKLVEQDNLKTSDEAFFANQSTIENNLTNNSYVYQRQKSQRKWVEKSKLEKEVTKPIFEETKIDTSYAESFVSKPKIDFVPLKPNFPNHTKKQTLKALHEKGITSRKNIDHWLKGIGKIYQPSKYSKDQINEAYENGCSCHMTGKKENLRDFRSLKNAGVVKFGNNQKCQVKGYGKITNGQFTVNRVAYVEGLQHNLISVSKLVVGTKNQVLFNEEGSIISNVYAKEVLLKSKWKGDMFTLDINPIVGKLAVCLLSKATSDLSWL